jgi:imidazoleglycerol phosphate dehydratase HisB
MENYIQYCENGASMAMQPERWITAFLFSQWISHFIKSLESRGGVSPTNRHLLIVDGHNSHVTLEVVHKAMQVGLDLLTLPSHTSHRLQPLDVSVFGPFKRAFKRFRDTWT